MASPTPSRRQSVDSSVLLSPILSPTASQTDLTAAYPPRASRPPKGRRGSTASSIISLNSSLGTVVDWRAPKDYAGGAGGGGSASTTCMSPFPTLLPFAHQDLALSPLFPSRMKWVRWIAEAGTKPRTAVFIHFN